MAFNLRLTEEQDRKLNELASASGTSKQNVIVSLIEGQWEREAARVITHAELDRIFGERRDLMDRLKDA